MVASVVLNRILIVLGFIGIFIAGFLSLSSFFKLSLPCGLEKGCDTVTTHPSAYLIGNYAQGGLPVSYLGFAAYIVLTILGVYRGVRVLENSRPLVYTGFIISLVGALYSGYLTYVALYEIHATCLWCLSSAATMVVTTLIYAMLLQTDAAPNPKRGKVDVVLTILMTFVVSFALGAGVSYQRSRGATLDGGLVMRVNENKTTLVDKDSHILGNVNAPVTIIEFADLLCPSCQQTYPVLEDLVKKSDGRVRVVFHHFPLFMKEDHKMALPAATIAEMASEEGKFWDFLAAMYSRPQAELQTMETIVDVYRSVGLNSETVMKRMNDPKDPAIQRVTDDLNLANNIKIMSTPTLIIQAHGGPIEQVPTSLLEEKLNTEPYKSLILGGAPAK
jgi:protein-disulfide isomerase/uncharacterized membrane protein